MPVDLAPFSYAKRKIASDEGRDRATVTKIVKSDEMHSHIQKMREQYYGLAGLAMEAVYRAVQQSNDGRLAHEILRNLGVIPSSEEVFAIQRQMQAADPLTEERGVKGYMFKMVEAAYERAQAFGTAETFFDEPAKPKQITERR